jgi:hypothetical protein
MLRRTTISLAAAVIVGIACVATVSTDAFARGGRAGVGVGRAGVGHVGRVGVAPVRRGVRAGVAVGVGAAARGAYGAYQCGYAPYPPCY